MFLGKAELLLLLILHAANVHLCIGLPPHSILKENIGPDEIFLMCGVNVQKKETWIVWTNRVDEWS